MRLRRESDAEQGAWLTFVVVGGGATGVEYAGALAELRKLIGREYREFSALRMRVVVVEGADRLLRRFPRSSGATPRRCSSGKASRSRLAS